MMNNNTSVMALIMIYENNVEIPWKFYRVLSCVFNPPIYTYDCADYLSCQSKILSNISINPSFKEKSFNLLLGIGIPELLLNLVSCNGFIKKPNSTLILNLRSRLINNYLAKVFYIIEKDSNQFSLIPNDVKVIINLINQMDTYFSWQKTKQFPN